MDSNAESLAKSSASLEPWSWVFTILVVIGVASEFWVIWHEHREEMETWALTFFGINRTVRPSTVRLLVEYASIALVAGGIIGELAIGIEIAAVNSQLRGIDIQLRSKNAELRTKSDQLLALVTQEAGDAKDSAQAANKAERELEKRAMKLDHKFSEYDREMTDSLLAWRDAISREFRRTGNRTLNPIAFRNALKNRPKGHVEVWANTDDDEAHNLGIEIRSALIRSEWDAGPTIYSLPPENTLIWDSLKVRCHPWDMKLNRWITEPKTAVEALLKAILDGVESPVLHAVVPPASPDNTLEEDKCVIEVHSQTIFEKQINNK